MTQRPSNVRIATIAGAALAGATLLAFGGFTLLNKHPSSSQTGHQESLSVYDGIWVDEQGAWHRVIFKGEQGILRSQYVDVHFSLVSTDAKAGVDTFSAREGLTGGTTTAVFALRDGQPKRLAISTDGSTSNLTYLKALSPAEAALLSAALASPAKPLVEQMTGDEPAAAAAAPKFDILPGTETLALLTDGPREADYQRQLTTKGYEDLTCVMGSEAPLVLEQRYYLTSTANAPPACGTLANAAFVLDIRTGKVAALIDKSQGGENLQERQYGDPALVTWLQGRYADGE